MKKAVKRALFTSAIAAVLTAASSGIAQQSQTAAPAGPDKGNTAQKGATDIQNLFDAKGDRNEPTYINSNSLTLKSDQRLFQYTGKVQVKHGEMTLNADFLDGKYNDKNQIQELVARKNVVITKGDAMKARCERAVYNAQTNVITLMENPELEQNGSVLAADAIKVFLDENRSVAEGQVRVKVVNVKSPAPSDQKDEPRKAGHKEPKKTGEKQDEKKRE